MKILAAYRSHRLIAFFIAMFAAALFSASPVAALAHELADHVHHSGQLDEGKDGPQSELCKICIGFTGSASAAVGDVPSLALILPSYVAPRTAPVAYFQPVVALPYLSRAPPRA